MVSRLGPGAEFDLIRSFLAGSPDEAPDVRVGPGDDCAVVTGGIAVTVDMAIEDVHFRRAWLSPHDIGYHAAAGALSDLAAVAARPIGILVSLALGPGDEAELGEAAMAGVRAAAGAVDAALLGGDVTRSPGPLVLDIAALGQVDDPVLRSGARPGDEVWVTGTLGAAAAAVDGWLAGAEPGPAATAAWARPTPRIRESLWLAERALPTAMVDLSDGIAGDAGHIAAASQVHVVIRAAALPVADAARDAAERQAAGSERPGPEPQGSGPQGSGRSGAIRLAAAGGEDYELCFTARPGAVEAARPAFEDAFGVALTRVGEVEEGAGAVVVDEEGKVMELRAYQHWGRG